MVDSAGTVCLRPKCPDKAQSRWHCKIRLLAEATGAESDGFNWRSNFDKNAVNRVILGTDGDFNVGGLQSGRTERFRKGGGERER